MLAHARAAARSASLSFEMRHRNEEPPAGSVPPPPLEMDSGPFAASGARRRRKDAVTLRTALLASGTAAALAVTGAGAVLLVHGEMNAPPERSSEPFGAAPTAAGSPDNLSGAHLASAPEDARTDTHTERAAVALAPAAPAQDLAASSAPSAPSGPAAAAAQALYSSAVRRIESNDFGGVDDLKRAANLGDAAAEFYLAKLYETGGAGVTKDLATARRWTERAAASGDPAAMHNLGLYYYEGEGGAQDAAEAARWFRRASDLGVRDSQYNLALLYAKGYGVPQNQAEAYKWYLIAAGEGDEGAKAAARALKPQLTLEAQSAAERSASAFRIQTTSTIRTAFARPTP
jgi:localization factor PodJL